VQQSFATARTIAFDFNTAVETQKLVLR